MLHGQIIMHQWDTKAELLQMGRELARDHCQCSINRATETA